MERENKGPSKIDQARETGKSILFMVATNPGPGLGICWRTAASDGEDGEATVDAPVAILSEEEEE